jgi:probable F420-dependent oxidoreductase
MHYGICLPVMTEGATREGIEAAAEVAERVGWSTVWATDHVLVDHSPPAADYRRIFDPIVTLAYVAARYPRVKLGTSVIVVPMRNAVILAKELATLDELSSGRVIAGVGVGWSRTEFENLGVGDRFHVRGAYLEETIQLWRHLWSGQTTPFRGRFHVIEDFTFAPLPAQGAAVPIWIGGGRSESAVRRAGRLGDGYHATASSPSTFAERVPILRSAAEEAGRPLPVLSTRVRVAFDATEGPFYALRGTPEEMAADVREFDALGLVHLALAFPATDPAGIVASVERFVRDVAPLV